MTATTLIVDQCQHRDLTGHVGAIMFRPLTITMNTAVPFGVYVNDQFVREHGTQQAASAHFDALLSLAHSGADERVRKTAELLESAFKDGGLDHLVAHHVEALLLARDLLCQTGDDGPN